MLGTMVEHKARSYPVSLLEVGDVLEADLYDNTTLLLPAGTVVTELFLKRLRRRRVHVVTSTSNILWRRSERVVGARSKEEELVAELAAASAELRNEAGLTPALPDEEAKSAQRSLRVCYQSLTESRLPSLTALLGHARRLLAHALNQAGKPDLHFNLRSASKEDTHAVTHSVNVTGLFAALNAPGVKEPSDMEEQMLGALLHDTGRIHIPSHVLTKNERFTPEERDVFQTHTLHGYFLLKDKLHLSPDVCAMARSHHERVDGKGYPDGLAGAEIPHCAASLALCDTFEALVTKRSYHREMTQAEAVRVIARSSGTQFAPMLVSRFVRTVGLYPTGTFVELTDGRVGMVTGHTEALMRPQVVIVGSVSEGVSFREERVDLIKEPHLAVRRHLPVS